MCLSEAVQEDKAIFQQVGTSDKPVVVELIIARHLKTHDQLPTPFQMYMNNCKSCGSKSHPLNNCMSAKESHSTNVRKKINTINTAASASLS